MKRVECVVAALVWSVMAVVFLALAAGDAHGTEASVQPRAGITVLGFDAPTGGVSAGLDGRALWDIREDVGVYAGAGIDVIGLTSGWYHMGIIAGPRAGAWYQYKKFYVSGGAGMMIGQLSICRSWEAGARQCMRWWGNPWNPWPEGHIHVGYRDDAMNIGLDISSLLLRPTWGTDGSISIAASGSWR